MFLWCNDKGGLHAQIRLVYDKNSFFGKNKACANFSWTAPHSYVGPTMHATAGFAGRCTDHDGLAIFQGFANQIHQVRGGPQNIPFFCDLCFVFVSSSLPFETDHVCLLSVQISQNSDLLHVCVDRERPTCVLFGRQSSEVFLWLDFCHHAGQN